MAGITFPIRSIWSLPGVALVSEIANWDEARQIAFLKLIPAPLRKQLINTPDHCGWTLLMRATTPETARQLLNWGADPNARTKDSHHSLTSTALALALEYRSEEVGLMLIAGGADPNVKSGDIAPLAYADTERLATALLNHSAIPDINSLITHSVFGNLEIVQRILERNPHLLNTQNADGRTILMQAAANGHDALVDFLLEQGTELDLRDEEGATALILAVYNEYGDIAQKLINAGANPNIEDNYQCNALTYARSNEREALYRITVLSDHGYFSLPPGKGHENPAGDLQYLTAEMEKCRNTVQLLKDSRPAPGNSRESKGCYETRSYGRFPSWMVFYGKILNQINGHSPRDIAPPAIQPISA